MLARLAGLEPATYWLTASCSGLLHFRQWLVCSDNTSCDEPRAVILFSQYLYELPSALDGLGYAFPFHCPYIKKDKSL